jgi:hypothetical protein
VREVCEKALAYSRTQQATATTHLLCVVLEADVQVVQLFVSELAYGLERQDDREKESV